MKLHKEFVTVVLCKPGVSTIVGKYWLFLHIFTKVVNILVEKVVTKM